MDGCSETENRVKNLIACLVEVQYVPCQAIVMVKVWRSHILAVLARLPAPSWTFFFSKRGEAPFPFQKTEIPECIQTSEADQEQTTRERGGRAVLPA